MVSKIEDGRITAHVVMEILFFASDLISLQPLDEGFDALVAIRFDLPDFQARPADCKMIDS